MLLRTIAGSTLCSVLVSGCTTFDLRAGFSEVGSMVEERTRMKLFWNNGTELDRQVGERLSKLVKGKLTAEQAAQVALLNNREVQAVYSELGVAQADLVQAGLLKNPLFDAIVTFPVTGGRPDLELTAVMSFLDIFYLPLRKRVAESRFEEAKTRVAAAVLDLAGQVRSPFMSIRQTNRCSNCANQSFNPSMRRKSSRNGCTKRGIFQISITRANASFWKERSCGCALPRQPAGKAASG